MINKFKLGLLALFVFTSVQAKPPNDCQKVCIEDYNRGINTCRAAHPDSQDDYWACVQPFVAGYDACLQGCGQK